MHRPLLRSLQEIIEGQNIHLIHLNVQTNRDLYGVFIAERMGLACISHLRSMSARLLSMTKRRLRDWEGDTVIGKGHRGALVTLVERKSVVHGHRTICRNTAKAVREAVVAGLAPYKNQVHT